MPDFHKLQVFLTVAEEGSFSAAAKKLHLTQSAISFQISALEEYYQAPLFERLSRGVALTETGEILKKYAREIIALSQRLDEDIAELKGLVRGRLTIGASTIPGEYILPRYIGIFTANFPKVEVNMKVADSKKVVDMVLAREIDLGMVGTLFDERKLVSRPVLSDRLLLIASPEHPLAKREKVELKDILDYPFVLRERGSGTRRVMERGLEEAGISPGQIKLRMELGSTEAVKTAVEEGLG
ncbi:LysR family transcriptional regulator, partial [Calderihabitans maritimus]